MNPREMIFVPEDWMVAGDQKAIDNAFEYNNENLAEVTSLANNFEPVQVRRKKG